jgi:hypothetical protein
LFGQAEDANPRERRALHDAICRAMIRRWMSLVPS